MNRSNDPTLDRPNSYRAAFHFLDRLFWMHQEEKAAELEHLGDLLSAMNPYAFADREAADPAAAADWRSVFGKMNAQSVTESFRTVIAFLESQEDWLELSFPLRLLREVTVGDEKNEYWQQWLEAIDEAMSSDSDVSRYRLRK